MKERLAMLEELEGELQVLDELIWEAMMKIEDIYSEDYHLGSFLSKVSMLLESAREENENALNEVQMEIDQYEY